MLNGLFIYDILILYRYALIAVTGFLVYGFDVNILVSKDISNYPGNYTSLILSALIVVGVACTVAPVISILASIPEEMMVREML